MDDPMAKMIKKKRDVEFVLPDLGDCQRMRSSGFIVPQEIPDHSWLKRGIQAAPNRYGIKTWKTLRWCGSQYRF